MRAHHVHKGLCGSSCSPCTSTPIGHYCDTRTRNPYPHPYLEAHSGRASPKPKPLLTFRFAFKTDESLVPLVIQSFVSALYRVIEVRANSNTDNDPSPQR